MKNLVDDSGVKCDELIDMSEIMSINSNDKNVLCKMDYCILHIILLVTILILIIFIIC